MEKIARFGQFTLDEIAQLQFLPEGNRMASTKASSRVRPSKGLSRRARGALVMAVATALETLGGSMGSRAQAQLVDTWQGTTDNTFSTGTNWTGGNSPPQSGDSLVFTSTNTQGNLDLNDNLTNGSFNVGNITFNSGALAYIIGNGTAAANAGNAFTLTGNITNNSASLETINDPFTVNSTQTLTSGSGNLLFGGVISGTGGFNIAGSGTVIFTGGNSYSGVTTINSGGTLQIGNNGGTGVVGNGTSSIVDNGTLIYNRNDSSNVVSGTVFANSISGTGNVTYNGGGAANIDGINTYTGITTISNNSVVEIYNAGNASLAVTNAFGPDPASFVANQLSFTGAGGSIYNFNNGPTGGSSLTIGANRGVYIASGATAIFNPGYGNILITINSVISGGGNLDTSNNSGNSLVLNAANTFTGNTSWTNRPVNSSYNGQIQLGNALALQNSTVIENFNSGTSGDGLTFNNANSGGSSYTIGGLSGGLAASGGGVLTQSLTDVSGNAITLSVGNNNQTTYYSGNLTGNGSLIKIGTGNLGLQQASTYSGGTIVSSGVLGVGLNSNTNISNGSATYNGSTTNPLGSGNITVAAGASLEFNPVGLTITNNITLNGVSYGTGTGNGHTATNNGVFDGALVVGTTSGGTDTLSGTLTLNADSNISASWSDKIISITGQVTGNGGLIVDPVGASRNGTDLQLGNSTNNYLGNTTISAKGNASSAPDLQTIAANVIPTTSNVFAYGTLDLDGSHSQAFNALNGNGTVTSTASGTPTVSIGNGNGTGTFSGIIQNGSASTLNLTKAGTGTETLSGPNTYSGATVLSGGILNVGASQTTTSGSLGDIAAGSISFAGGTLQYSANNHFDYSPYFRTTAGQQYSIDTNNQTVTFLTPLISSGGTLTKYGLGQLSLSGNNTFTGNTTINGGGLLLSGGTLASGTVMVGNGSNSAYLTATGNGNTTGVVTGSVSVAGNGSIDFSKDGATSTAQTLSVGSLYLTTGGNATTSATLGFNLTGASLSDRITTTGNLTLGSTGNAIVNLFGSGVTGNYTLISYANQTGQAATNTGPGDPFVIGNMPSGLFTSTLDDTATALILQISANPTPAVAYWYGGYNASTAGGNTTGTWGGNNGNSTSPLTNWSGNSTGSPDTGQVPGSSSDVVFTASNISTGAAITTTLETNYSINSLTVNSTPGSVTIGGTGNLNLNAAPGTLYSAGTGIVINAGAGPLAINTSGTVTAGASQTWTNSSSSTFTVASGIAGTATAGNTTVITLSNAGSGNTTLSGQISNGSLGGQLALTINNSGSGVTTLSNAENTFSGVTTVSAGTLDVNGAQALLNSTLNPVSGNVVFGSGIGNFTIGGISGTVNVPLNDAGNNPVTLSIGNNNGNTTYSGTFTGSGSVTKIGSGSLQLGNANTLQTPTITLSAGSLAFSPNIGNFSFGGLSGSGNIALIDTSSSPVTISVGNNNASTAYSGNLSGTGSLTKIGTGTLSLTAPSSYSGGTVISTGVLAIGLNNGGTVGGSVTYSGSVSNPLGSGNITIAAGASLQINPSNAAFTNNITLNGLSYGGNTATGNARTNNGIFDGAIMATTANGASVTNLSGTITLNATSNFTTDYSDKTLLLSGQVTGAGGLTIDSAAAGRNGSVIELSNNTNNYQGDTTIDPQGTASSAPTLLAGAANVVPSGSGTGNVNDYGTFNLNSFNQLINGLNGNGSVTSSGTPTFAIGGTAANGSFSGTIQNAVAVVKTGIGTQTLSGSSSYSGGTTVSAGTLFANNASSSLGTGAVNVNGGLLAGNGKIANGANALAVNSGGTIGAGATAALAGTLTSTGGQTWNSGGTYLWKLTGAAHGAGTASVAVGSGGSGSLGSPAGAGVEGADWDQLVMSGLTLNSTTSSAFTISLSSNISGAAYGQYSWIIAQTQSTTLPNANITAGDNLLSGGSNSNDAGLFALNTTGFSFDGVSNPSPNAFSVEFEPLGSGGDLDLVLDYNAAPEPGAVLLVLPALVPLLAGRRRRRSRECDR